jgi:hypothetical protein
MKPGVVVKESDSQPFMYGFSKIREGAKWNVAADYFIL